MLRFRALGAPDLRGDVIASPRTVLTQPRLLALLTYLAAARPRGFHRRDSLVALFWPEQGHEHARNALRQVVHRLRRAVGEDVVAGRGADEIGISPDHLWCDVVEFEAAIETGHASEALELYGGDLLPGFFISDAPEFERWLDEERSRLRHRAASVAWGLAESEATREQAGLAAQFARRAASLSGDDESAVRRHIELLVRVGDRPSATRVYESFVQQLEDELGIQPSRETQALARSLQQSSGETVHIAALHDGNRSRWSPLTPASGASAPRIEVAQTSPGDTVPHGDALPSRIWTWRLAASLLVGLVAVSTAATMLVRRQQQRESGTTAVRTLAVFPFAVRGASEMSYLREGMVDLLSAKMNGATGFQAVDPRSVIAATGRGEASPEPNVTRTIARRLGAQWLLTGEVVQIAGRLQVSATLSDIADRSPRVATASVEGEATDLFQLVDDLTGRLLASVAVGRDTSLIRLSALTTHSLPAMKAFLAGEQALRAGRDGAATAAFQEAARLDTTFALAQYRLALSSTWASTATTTISPSAWAALAARNAQRLTPLVRDLLAAYDAYKAVRADDAERMYRAIATQHPDNIEAWYMLAETHFHYNYWRGRPPDESKAEFERVLTLDPSDVHALVHLARLAARDGRLRDLDSLAQWAAVAHRDAERLVELRAAQAFTRTNEAAQAAVFHEAAAAGDLVVTGVFDAALVYGQNPDLGPSLARLLLAAVGDTVIRGYAFMALTSLPLARGQMDRAIVNRLLGRSVVSQWLLESEAIVAAEPLYRVPRDRIAALRDSVRRDPYRMTEFPSAGMPSDGAFAPDLRNYLIGLLSARLGDFDASAASEKALAAVRSMPRAEFASLLAIALHAEILRSKGQVRDALAEIERFRFDTELSRSFPHWGSRERFLRGELLYAVGRYTEALPWFESMGTAYDLPYFAPAHLRIAQIRERMGDTARARFHYNRFERMWREADPERQPIVASARAALGRLTVTQVAPGR